MAKLLITIVLIGAALANIRLDSKNLSVGQACDGYAPYNISAFNVQPWPPVFGQKMTFSMQGTFQMTVSVAYLATGQSCDYQNWEYTQFPINKNFTAGQTAGFSETITSGSAKGNCYLQVTLHGAPPEELFITCWEVNYQLN